MLLSKLFGKTPKPPPVSETSKRLAASVVTASNKSLAEMQSASFSEPITLKLIDIFSGRSQINTEQINHFISLQSTLIVDPYRQKFFEEIVLHKDELISLSDKELIDMLKLISILDSRWITAANQHTSRLLDNINTTAQHMLYAENKPVFLAPPVTGTH